MLLQYAIPSAYHASFQHSMPPSLAARGRAAHDPALVVEVAQYNMHAFANRAEGIRDGDTRLVERDVCRTRGG